MYLAELSKAKDTGKFGVGYFQPDDCDNDKIPCVFTPYPEYENLKKAYTTTKNSTVKFDDYTPKRDKILTCPTKAIKTDLQTTPKVDTLSCSVGKPVCNGKKANDFKKTTKATKLDDKKSPTNSATEGTQSSTTDDKSADGKSSNAMAVSTASMAASLVSVAAMAVLAM